MTAPDSYVICTSPRSGSTLLCLLLAGTGVAGNPQSWFHTPSVARWAEALGVAREPARDERTLFADVVAAARKAGAAGSGVFGLRMQAHSLEFFQDRLATLFPERQTAAARIEAAFGTTRYIHLHRQDKVAQAVSYLMAQQSGLWHAAADGREIERSAPPAEPRYDPVAIGETVARMQGYDRMWDDWFAGQGMAPFRVDYDALSDHPRDQLRDVLAALGRDPGAAGQVAVPTMKLAGATSRDWVRRYREEIGSA
ncbi:MAG: Stf0 family sulfotransferase [Paracoccaceae bacterium]